MTYLKHVLVVFSILIAACDNVAEKNIESTEKTLLQQGQWSEFIQHNTDKKTLETSKEKTPNAALKATELAFAYLQIGDDNNAKQTLKSLTNSSKYKNNDGIELYLASTYAYMVMERQDWQFTSQIPQIKSNENTTDTYNEAKSIEYFIRSLGYSFTNSHKQSELEIQKLSGLFSNTKNIQKEINSPLIKEHKVRELAAKAWLEFNKLNKNDGIKIMKKAVKLQDEIKNTTLPMPIPNTHEMLADMLQERGFTRKAREHYTRSLTLHPNRLNSLFGVGFSHQQEGNFSDAFIFFNKTVSLASNQDINFKKLIYAKQFVDAENERRDKLNINLSPS